MEKIKTFIKENQKYILAIGSAVVIIVVGMVVALAYSGKNSDNTNELTSTLEVAAGDTTPKATTTEEQTTTTQDTTKEEMTENPRAEGSEETSPAETSTVQPTTTQETTAAPTTTVQQTTEQQTTAPVVKQPCPYQDYTQYDFTLEVANEVLTKEAGFPSHFSSLDEVCQWIDKVNGFECFVNADTSKPMYFCVYSITKCQNDPEYSKNHYVNSDCITGDTDDGCFVHSAGGNGFLQYDEVIGFQVEFTDK